MRFQDFFFFESSLLLQPSSHFYIEWQRAIEFGYTQK